MIIKYYSSRTRGEIPYNQMNLVLLIVLAHIGYSLKFLIKLGPQEQRCFYQLLATQQKYAVEVTPTTQGQYFVDIRHQENKEWLHSVSRRTRESFQNVSLFKLTSKQSLYSFCLSNDNLTNLTLRVELRWGLELLELDSLAQESDQEGLLKEARWIDKQADKVLELLASSSQQLTDRGELQDLMGLQLVFFAVMGVIAVLALNSFFYFSLRRIFRERKMI